MTYCFDIDGTICTLTNGDYKKAKPIQDRIDLINKLYADNHTIIFHTARGMGRFKNNAEEAQSLKSITRKQLDNWDVNYHELFMGKPAADLYIDDKGLSDEKFFGN